MPHPTLVSPLASPDGTPVGRTDILADDDDFLETRRRCVEKNADRKCVWYENYDVRCVRRAVGLRVDLRMTREADRRIDYRDSKTRDRAESSCEDGAAFISDDAALRSMAGSIAQEVRRDLTPYRERYTIRISEDRAGLTPIAAERFRAAIRLTKCDQTAACAIFAGIGDLALDHGATLFNRALCAEAIGRYDKASDLTPAPASSALPAATRSARAPHA